MPQEIERKFLVTNDPWRANAQGVLCRQGYLNSAQERTVRVRTMGNKGFLTIKGPTIGISRLEYEYEIPVAHCNDLLDHLAEHPLIEKKRYTIHEQGVIWEIDEFFGENQGLIIAEIELEYEAQAFAKPAWLGKEVTGLPRYYNSHLSACPYSSWAEADKW